MTKPSKMAQYLAEGDRLRDAVNAYRAERGDDEPSSEAPPKSKYPRLPPLATPTELDGWPLNPNPPAEIPDYDSMSRVQAIRRRQWEATRRSATKPTGAPTLRKRDQSTQDGAAIIGAFSAKDTEQ